MEPKLRFCIGAIADFISVGVDPGTCRTSLDNTMMIIHQEDLTDDQFAAILDAVYAGKSFDFMFSTNPKFVEMINSPAWADGNTL